MIRSGTRALFVLALSLPAAGAAQSIASDSGVLQAVEVARIWLDAQHDYEQIPSISVAIVHDQDLVWSGAVGVADVEDGRPATTPIAIVERATHADQRTLRTTLDSLPELVRREAVSSPALIIVGDVAASVERDATAVMPRLIAS